MRRSFLTQAALWGALCVAVGAAGPGTARAQLAASLDAGTGQVRYDGDLARVTVVTVSPSILYERALTTASISSTVTRFNGDVFSARGQLGGSAFTPALGVLRAEVAGRGAASTHRDLARAYQLFGQGRVHALTEGWGGWVGGGAGRAWRDSRGGGLYRTEAGAWLRRGMTSLRGSISRTSIRDGIRRLHLETTPDRAASGTVAQVVESIGPAVRTYVDAEVVAHWVPPLPRPFAGALAFDASVGRRDEHGMRDFVTWGVGGSLQVAEYIAVVGGTGRYAADVPQSLPGGSYATIALRFSSRPPVRPPPRVRHKDILLFSTDRETDSTSVFRVYAPRARAVELMGDFTDWQAVPFRHTLSGLWEVRLPVSPGVHRVNLRIDGGDWVVPPGFTPVTDDFNGAVGVVVIGA